MAGNQQLTNLFTPDPQETNLHFDERLTHLLLEIQRSLARIEIRLADLERPKPPVQNRSFYNVAEFAKLVGKSEYTVREWCRLYRINAEKSDSGHGDSKAWKIPANEVERYRDHGLLPIPSKF